MYNPPSFLKKNKNIINEKKSLSILEANKEKSYDNEENLKLKSGSITVDDVVEKLNSIRSGKSLKDEEVSSSFKKYFDELKSEEKVALFAFLKGISQIVTGEIDPGSAVDPSDRPARIEMQKKGGPVKRTLKPLVVKAPEAEKSKKSSSEDTSGPVPISPKKK